MHAAQRRSAAQPAKKWSQKRKLTVRSIRLDSILKTPQYDTGPFRSSVLDHVDELDVAKVGTPVPDHFSIVHDPRHIFDVA